MASERAQCLVTGRNPAPDCDFAIGHEAIVVGATLELRLEDTMAASPRNFAAQVAKGTSVEALLSQAPQENGTHPDGAVRLDPFNLGTGLALAHRLEKKRNVVVALCNTEDVATPDCWYDAMKFAGIHKLPIIYVLKSSSAFEPVQRNPALEELSFMARGCGFPAVIVDGNDAVAVWRVTQESIHRARNGAGPTLIECETRFTEYQDPLAHMEHYMRKRGVWDDQWRRDTAEGIESEINAASARGIGAAKG